jgi:hypothetical protein
MPKVSSQLEADEIARLVLVLVEVPAAVLFRVLDQLRLGRMHSNQVLATLY